MDKLMRTALLFDFYSLLLTAKQRSFYEMYYLYDLSLSEIAEANGITPQAVSDLLKRTVKILDGYESKLGMLKQHIVQKKLMEEIGESIDELINSDGLCPKVCEQLLEIKEKTRNALAL